MIAGTGRAPQLEKKSAFFGASTGVFSSYFHGCVASAPAWSFRSTPPSVVRHVVTVSPSAM
ncbi:MAG TPA: hypothetical protein VGL81_35480 [Polyangiaceae bacterium]